MMQGDVGHQAVRNVQRAGARLAHDDSETLADDETVELVNAVPALEVIMALSPDDKGGLPRNRDFAVPLYDIGEAEVWGDHLQ